MVTKVSGLDPNDPSQSWWSSSQAFGVTTITNWSTDNVRVEANGTVDLVLDDAPAGSAKPFMGGEINSYATATTGTFSWTAQAPKMVDGAVFGLFAYKVDHATQPWLEFDYEFAGKNSNKVNLTVHMVDASGKHITNICDAVIDLGFDASAGFHTYDVMLTGQAAVFHVDGEVVAYFSAADMPGDVWMTGSLKSVADLWAADSSYDSWTGHWTDPGVPLVGRISAASVRAGDLSGKMPLLGTTGDNTLSGTSGRDVMDGLSGNDTLRGGDGNDRIAGGHGNDTFNIDSGNDWLNGGTGTDWIKADGSVKVALDLGNWWGSQNTGYGTDELRNIENASGSSSADKLYGTDEANVLRGEGGDDFLDGRKGADILRGGTGRDVMDGGLDQSRDVFIFNAANESGLTSTFRDVLWNFTKGTDDVDLSGIDANASISGDQAFTWGGTTAGAYRVWTATSSSNTSNTLLRGDVTGDGAADFEIQIDNVSGLSVNDLLL